MKIYTILTYLKKWRIIQSIILLLPFTAAASIIAPEKGCDTLISKEGRVILVDIVDITESSIRFRLCEDNSVPYIEMPRSAVREIRPNFNKEDQIELSPEEEIRLTQRARAAAFWGWAPLLLSPLLFLAGLWFLLIPLEIFGFIFTVRILRKIPKSKKYRNQRGLAIFGLIGSIHIALGILVILLVLYGWSQTGIEIK